jgi:flagellar protein FlgJ
MTQAVQSQAPAASANVDNTAKIAKLDKACRDLEAMFVGELLKAMRNSIPESNFLPEMPGSDVYESMFDQQLAGYLSQGRGMGLGQAVFNQMANAQGLDPSAETLAAIGRLNYQATINPALMAAKSGGTLRKGI